jgi:AbrB family looped-hinge helix DNA binding protein
MATIVRARKKGQVTIPDGIRKELGIEENTLLRVGVQDGEVRMRPVHVRDEEVGSPWLLKLYEYFAPVREEILRQGYTEEEVNAAIDEAFREVRAAQVDPRDTA